MSTSRIVTTTLLSILLLAPLALANHTPPGNDTVDGGDMKCDGRRGSGVATTTLLPIIRTTDNGHLKIYADAVGAVSADGTPMCKFEVVITGYTLPYGVNPTGGLNNIVSSPCAGGACTPTAEADWWVTFMDPINNIYTPEIDVLFDLKVNGATVASGMVRIGDPSVPAVLHLL